MREFLTVPELFAAILVCRRWNTAAAAERDRRVLPLIPRFVEKKSLGDLERRRSSAAMLCTTLLDCASCLIRWDVWDLHCLGFLRNLIDLDRQWPVDLAVAKTTANAGDYVRTVMGLNASEEKWALLYHGHASWGALRITVVHRNSRDSFDVAFVDNETSGRIADKWCKLTAKRYVKQGDSGCEHTSFVYLPSDVNRASGAVLRWILSQT